MSAENMGGIYAMLITPFNKNEEVDYEALRAEVDWCVEQGVDGVVATPSIGEFACLTDDERYKCFEVVKDQAGKHSGIQVVGTIADTHTRKIVQHAKVAKELGFVSAQLVPPYYWVPEEEEVYRHYSLAAETGLPIVVYHNPKLSKFYMTREFIARLADISGVVAIKEVKTDRHVELEPLYKLVKGKINIFHTYRVFTTGLLLGSSGGFINAFAVPHCVKMWKMFNEEGITEKLEQIQNLVNEVFPRGGEDNKRHIGTTKMAASVVSGIDFGAPRAPYLLPEDRIKEKLTQMLPELNSLCGL